MPFWNHTQPWMYYIQGIERLSPALTPFGRLSSITKQDSRVKKHGGVRKPFCFIMLGKYFTKIDDIYIKVAKVHFFTIAALFFTALYLYKDSAGEPKRKGTAPFRAIPCCICQ